MRIAMISEHASPLALLGSEDAGGQNAHVAELSMALARLGHEVRVYTRRDHPDTPLAVPLVDGVTVTHLPAGPAEPVGKDSLLPHMRQFQDALAEHWRDHWQPGVAHAHFWMSGLAALGAGRQCGVPVVQTYHALGTVKRRHQGADDASPAGRIGYERLLGRTVDRVIAQCGDEVSELVRMGVPRSQVTVVPSGVDPDLFCPNGPAVARTDGLPRVLTVGRLVERKGYADLIRAMTLVPDAELVVVGGPPPGLLRTDPKARWLRELAEAYHLADRVRLVGAVPKEEMPQWYRSADVLACAPWYEPFGLTPLEAMACGVPVVATAVGGLTDTIVDKVTGLLTPPRDPRALAAALRTLLSDPLQRLAYGAAAADRARHRYSWERTATELLAVYAAVAAVPDAVPGTVTDQELADVVADDTGDDVVTAVN